MTLKLRWIALMLMVICSLSAFAEEAVLIDFSTLKADILPFSATNGKMTQNRATMMDFSAFVGQSYTAEQREQMKSSLAIENWVVQLVSSAKSFKTQSLSYTREALIKSTGRYFPNKTVLGVRINFPEEHYNCWARIIPPFEIPAFENPATIDDRGNITETITGATTNNGLSRFEGSYDSANGITNSYGIVKNVGSLKRVGVWVRGMNQPHGLYVILIDSENNERLCFLGYLNFDGWRELIWENPQYISDVRNRELNLNPLYPTSLPFVRFGGFQITRDAISEGGDFIAYFKEVRILYDKASISTERDIDDEELWGIMKKRENDRKKLTASNFGRQQVLRYLESLKLETEDQFTLPPDVPETR